MLIIPSINCGTFEEAKAQIERDAEFSEWLHIDVSDGQFTPHTSWGNPEELKNLVADNKKLQTVKFEVHLMVTNPEGIVDSWLRTGAVRRIVVHLEAMTDSVYLLEKCRKYGAEAMLALNPGTEAERLLAHAGDFRSFQILAVPPGRSGQEFNPAMVEKVKKLRTLMPNAIIEVDGGVNAERAVRYKEAGADILISGSYIANSSNPAGSFTQLSEL